MSFDMFSLPLVECSGSSSMLCSFCVLVIEYYSRRWAELTFFFFFFSFWSVSDYDGALEQGLQTQGLAG